MKKLRKRLREKVLKRQENCPNNKDLVKRVKDRMRDMGGHGMVKNIPNSGQVPCVREQMKDQIPGGLGDNRPDSDFDLNQLAKGIQVELEHTHDLAKAKEIAKDHLTEVGNYYIDSKGKGRLEELEEKAEKELKN